MRAGPEPTHGMKISPAERPADIKSARRPPQAGLAKDDEKLEADMSSAHNPTLRKAPIDRQSEKSGSGSHIQSETSVESALAPLAA